MALITQIRNRAGIAVGIIALGLGLFVVGGDLISSSSVLMGKKNQLAGEIAGKDIDIKDFSAKVEELKNAYFVSTGKTPGENEMQGINDQAWNELIFEYSYLPEFEKLGLQVSEDELTDMVQGKNIHPALIQSFTNPQNGQFDKANLMNFLQNFDKLDPKQQYAWSNFEKNLTPDRLRTKYTNLLKMSTYVTKNEGKREFEAQNNKVDLKYLYVPYFTIVDSTIKVDDDKIKEYIAKNPLKFKTDQSANVEYVTFNIAPSSEDTASVLQEITDLKSDFLTSDDDSSYVRLHSDNIVDPKFVTYGELPSIVTSMRTASSESSIIGPIFENGSYKLYKVGKEKSDTNYSARASHILIKFDSETPEGKASAKIKANDILKQIKGGSNFELMARIYGTDGSKEQGGDLGWFTKGNMVKEFENAVFGASSKGLLPNLVETQFGYHIIKVTETKNNKKVSLAIVERVITAGDLTRENIYKQAEQFSQSSKDAVGFDAEIKKDAMLTKQIANNVLTNSQYVNGLQNPKELIRWFFSNESEVNKTSQVFEIGNQYVVSLIKSKYKDGEVNFEFAKQDAKSKVLNDLKAEKIKSKLGTVSSIDESAQKYGTDAQVNTASSVTLSSGSIASLGFDPYATGVALGLKEGKKSSVISGENGVSVLEAVKIYPSTPVADFTLYINQLKDRLSQSSEYLINDLIRDYSKIKDNRYKFF